VEVEVEGPGEAEVDVVKSAHRGSYVGGCGGMPFQVIPNSPRRNAAT
jgi:hypothetical protein